MFFSNLASSIKLNIRETRNTEIRFNAIELIAK
jgi:hypothetical protein